VNYEECLALPDEKSGCLIKVENGGDCPYVGLAGLGGYVAGGLGSWMEVVVLLGRRGRIRYECSGMTAEDISYLVSTKAG